MTETLKMERIQRKWVVREGKSVMQVDVWYGTDRSSKMFQVKSNICEWDPI